MDNRSKPHPDELEFMGYVPLSKSPRRRLNAAPQTELPYTGAGLPAWHESKRESPVSDLPAWARACADCGRIPPSADGAWDNMMLIAEPDIMRCFACHMKRADELGIAVHRG